MNPRRMTRQELRGYVAALVFGFWLFARGDYVPAAIVLGFLSLGITFRLWRTR